MTENAFTSFTADIEPIELVNSILRSNAQLTIVVDSIKFVGGFNGIGNSFDLTNTSFFTLLSFISSNATITTEYPEVSNFLTSGTTDIPKLLVFIANNPEFPTFVANLPEFQTLLAENTQLATFFTNLNGIDLANIFANFATFLQENPELLDSFSNYPDFEALLQQGEPSFSDFLTFLADNPDFLTFIATDPEFSGFIETYPAVLALLEETNTGDVTQTSFYDGSLPLGIAAGILLTSGDGTPPVENTSSAYSVRQEGNTDADLQIVANSAFAGAGEVQDVNSLEFSFTITNPSVQSITFDLVFGSDEFPEFSNSSFVDVAAVFVNGVNYALFNNEPTQPLSIIDTNLNRGNFIYNSPPEGIEYAGEIRELPIEYDGISSVLSIFAPVQLGENTIKFAVGDTGDQIYDSGLFIANLTTSSLSADNNGGVLLQIIGTEGDDELTGTDNNEFFNLISGNNFVDPGFGNDVVQGGSGNDSIVGGKGNNIIDGGGGTNTVIYENDKAEYQIEVVDDNTIKVGSNTDTLTNVQILEFADQTIEVSSLFEDDQEPPTPVETTLLFGGIGNDTFDAADPNDSFDGNNTLLFTGGGDDLIDTSAATVGNNRIFAGGGNDTIIAGKDDLIFAGDGNDEIILTEGQGGNRVYAGSGDDTLILGADDILFGGSGNDRFFVGTGGNNIMTGGEGADQFWIATAGQIPAAGNRITDFTPGEDVLGIGGNFGEQLDSFADLEIVAADGVTSITVQATNDILVTLNGEFALTDENFVFDSSLTI